MKLVSDLLCNDLVVVVKKDEEGQKAEARPVIYRQR